MKFGRIATPGAFVIALGALLAVSGCKTASQWQFSRQGKSGKITTLVTVRTQPTDAEVSVDGKYQGRSPVEIPIRYVYKTRVYERKEYFPYPHFEERELVGYERNDFTIGAFVVGYRVAEKEIELKGEEKIELVLTLEKRTD
ncbi:MAG: PEGA domain-containing protein [Planctomycetota bacterium]